MALMNTEPFLYLFNIPNLTPLSLLALFLLSLMRLAPIIGLAPFLGGKLTPVPTRIGAAIVFTLAFLPIVVTHAGHEDLGFDLRFTMLALKELFLGTVMGYLISIPFFIAQSSGILVDYLRGASIMQAQDPTMQNQSSSIGNLFNYILLVLFFQIDGPFIFFDTFLKSYQLIPPDAFINPKFFNLHLPLWETSLVIMHHILALSVQLAAPALLAVLMTELFLGIANRLAPQVQISFLGMSLKSLIGLFVLWVGWIFILKQTSIETLNWLSTFNRIIDSFAPYKML